MYELVNQTKAARAFSTTKERVRPIRKTRLARQKDGTWAEEEYVEEQHDVLFGDLIVVPETLDTRDPGVTQITDAQYAWLVENDATFESSITEKRHGGLGELRCTKLSEDEPEPEPEKPAPKSNSRRGSK
jgi:hypothetical protein